MTHAYYLLVFKTNLNAANIYMYIVCELILKKLLKKIQRNVVFFFIFLNFIFDYIVWLVRIVLTIDAHLNSMMKD